MNDDYRIVKIISVISIILLIVALFDMPYSYYRLLRFLLFVGAAYTSYSFYKIKNNVLMLINILILALYNPIIPLHMNREFWTIINILTIVGFGYNIFEVMKTKKEVHEKSE